MANITIGFSRPKTWKPYAWLIMKLYNTSYDHVYIKFYSESYQRELIYQASGIRVNFMSHEIFFNDNICIAEFDIGVSEEDKKKTIQFAIDNCGKPYGIKAAIGLGIVRICEMFGKTIKNPLDDGQKTYVCCELAAQILINIGYKFNKDVDNISPKDLNNFLVDNK